MHQLNLLASFDKQKNEHEPLGWKIVTSKECKQKHDFENVDEPAVKLYIHSEFKPAKLQAPDDDLSFEKLATWVTIKYV